MNKKTKKQSERSVAGLSFKRETVRALSADEIRRVAGARPCQTSCHAPTCPNSVCTITVDTTL